MPKEREHGSRSLFLGVSEQKPDDAWSGIGGFLGSVLSSTLRWHDNSYLVLPGYKGRVIEIWQSREDAARFFASAIAPNLPEGIRPKLTFEPLHDLLQP